MGTTLTVEEANGTSVGPPPTVVRSSAPLTTVVASEIDQYLQSIQAFSRMDPDEVLRLISAVTARLAYLRVQLMREGGQRANKLRTSELDPLMENLDLQFKIASRLLTSRQFDFEVTRGAPS